MATANPNRVRFEAIFTVRFGHLTGSQSYGSTGTMYQNSVSSFGFSSEQKKMN